MKCTKCKGVGKFFPPEGITKADMKHCNICDGTGERPNGYKTKKQKTKNRRKEYLNKQMGFSELLLIEGV